MEKVLSDHIIRQVNEAFTEMKEPVQLLYFGSKDNCCSCKCSSHRVARIARARYCLPTRWPWKTRR